jgi:hypothetical protein
MENYRSFKGKHTFSLNNNGSILFSSRFSHSQIATMGIEKYAGLRWIDERHVPFLQWHREKVFKA